MQSPHLEDCDKIVKSLIALDLRVYQETTKSISLLNSQCLKTLLKISSLKGFFSAWFQSKLVAISNYFCWYFSRFTSKLLYLKCLLQYQPRFGSLKSQIIVGFVFKRKMFIKNLHKQVFMKLPQPQLRSVFPIIQSPSHPFFLGDTTYYKTLILVHPLRTQSKGNILNNATCAISKANGKLISL